MEDKVLDVVADNSAEQDEIMVKIENVKKQYTLGVIGGTTLKDSIARWWAKIRKKEDPTKKIGAKKVNQGEKFMALNGVSFEVKKGEAIALIGHNGAGKSTLLKLITRVTAPTEGKIYLNGRVASMLEVGTGFHAELTGRENVYMNGAILGMTKKEIDAKIDDIIEFSEVGEFIDTPVKRYSSGMFVKLAFSVAAHLDAEIMLMDEVLAVGDMAFQNKCINKMKEVANSGKTIIYVSHNMATIRALCNRCVVLNKGEVEFVGAVEEGIAKYLGEENNTLQLLFKDFRNREKIYPQKVEFLSFKVLEKKSCYYKQGENLEFELELGSNINMDGIFIRSEIYSKSKDIIASSYTAEPLLMEKGKKYFVKMVLNSKFLVEGDYIINFNISRKNMYGVETDLLDVVKNAFCFTIIKAKETDIEWKTKYWGYVQYEDTIIKEVKESGL